MIDFISYECEISNYEKWKTQTTLSLYIGLDESTGEVKEFVKENVIIKIRNGVYRNYRVQLFEYVFLNKRSYKLKVSGSIHKAINLDNNFRPVHFSGLIDEIKTHCKELRIEPNNCKLRVLEFGVSIQFPIPVFPFIRDNLLFYSRLKERSDFTILTGKSKIGFQFVLSDYRFKIYDTALKHNFKNECWMKIELHYSKMRELNKKGIQNLFDLMQREKVEILINDLNNKWNLVLLSEEVNLRRLNKRQLKLYNSFNTRNFLNEMKSLPASTLKDRRNSYETIIKQFGKGYKDQINESIEIQLHKFLNSVDLYQ